MEVIDQQVLDVVIDPFCEGQQKEEFTFAGKTVVVHELREVGDYMQYIRLLSRKPEQDASDEEKKEFAAAVDRESRAFLIIKSVHDESGKRLYNDDDLERLASVGGMRPHPFTVLSSLAMNLSGFMDRGVAQKNS